MVRLLISLLIIALPANALAAVSCCAIVKAAFTAKRQKVQKSKNRAKYAWKANAIRLLR